MREFALVAKAAEARGGERLADLLVLGHYRSEELRALAQLVRAVRKLAPPTVAAGAVALEICAELRLIPEWILHDARGVL